MATTFGCLRKFAQGRAQIVRRFHRLGRMPADGGIDVGKFFGEPDRAFAAVEARADGNDFGDAGGLRARDDFRQIRRVVGIIKMRVRVEKDGA